MRTTVLRGKSGGVIAVLLALLFFTGVGSDLLARLGFQSAASTLAQFNVRASLFGGEHLSQSVAGSRNGESRRTFWAVSGQTVSLTYDATVQRGRLWVRVEEAGVSPTTVWEAHIDRSMRHRATLKVPKTGNYELVVSLWDFGGRYDVSSSVK